MSVEPKEVVPAVPPIATERLLTSNSEVTYECEGDRCFPVRKPRVETKISPPPPQLDRHPLAASQQWGEYTPSSKKLFTQGPVWVMCGQPCTNRLQEPFQVLMELLKSKDASGETDHERSAVTMQQQAAARAPWAYPRVFFNTNAHMDICEKAFCIYGRTPFLGLMDLPNSAAYVLDLLPPAPSSKSHRHVKVFQLVDDAQISAFVLGATLGTWPKALLGEAPSPGELDPLTSHTLTATFKAVQSTLPRLVRGEVRTVHEAIRLVALSTTDRANQHDHLQHEANETEAPADQQQKHSFRVKGDHGTEPRKDRRHAGATGSGPLLSLLTLWAPRCPCCPSLIRMLDSLTAMMTSVQFRELFPDCPLLTEGATLRHVTLDVDQNDLHDDEWPSASEYIDVPSLPLMNEATPTSNKHVPPSEIGNSAVGHPERALPTIMAYRDGVRIATFRGMRTPRNLVSFLARVVTPTPSPIATKQFSNAEVNAPWMEFLQELIEDEEDEEDDFDALRKRSRTNEGTLAEASIHVNDVGSLRSSLTSV